MSNMKNKLYAAKQYARRCEYRHHTDVWQTWKERGPRSWRVWTQNRERPYAMPPMSTYYRRAVYEPFGWIGLPNQAVPNV